MKNKFKKILIVFILIMFILLIAYIIFKKVKFPFTLTNITENNEEYSSEYNQINSTNTFFQENYEVVSGEYLSGKIVDITDKYLKVQNENNEIKLVKIDWDATNFVNCRTQENLAVQDIKIGDYFLNNQIIRNITGQELIKESLKNIVDNSTTILFVPTKIISIKDMDGYYIVKIEMEDTTSKYFGKSMENIDKYELEFIINNDTKFYPEGKGISISTIQDICNQYMTTIFIDEKSIDSQYPIITKVEVYDI